MASTSYGNRDSENLTRLSYNLVISRHVTSQFSLSLHVHISYLVLVSVSLMSFSNKVYAVPHYCIHFIYWYLSFTERMQYHLYSATKAREIGAKLDTHSHTHTHARISFVISINTFRTSIHRLRLTHSLSPRVEGYTGFR